jgi:hypothetical protein
MKLFLENRNLLCRTGAEKSHQNKDFYLAFPMDYRNRNTQSLR